MNKDQENRKEAIFEFGDICPKVGTWVFPSEPSKEPYQIEDQGDNKDDPPQST